MRRSASLSHRVGTSAALALAALSLLGSGCATNPATGNRQLSLIGEQQEIAMGRQSNEEIVASMGLYDNLEIQNYVSDLGLALASKSERPHLPWTFQVIDDPVVNAFALPGGYIYITRGIMAHMNSEAELVSVIGHEIGHVTARHSVNQLSKAQLANIGLAVGMAVEPRLRSFSGLAQDSLQLMFLKFSRDDERQADELGVRYAVRGGWDPSQMAEMFDVLQRVSQASGAGRIPGWMSTHPDPGNRQQRVAAQIAAKNIDTANLRIEKDSYLRTLEGLVFGDDPREGFFRGSRFLHPDLAFRIDFPEGWQARNQKSAVGAVSPEQDAVVLLTLAEQVDPRSAARAFFAQEGISSGETGTGRIHGLSSAWGTFRASSQQGTLAGEVVFIRHGSNTFRLLGYTDSDRWRGYSATVARSLRSFAEVTDRGVLHVEPARLEIIEVNRTMTLEDFDSRYPSSVDLETMALINDREPGESIEAGALVKRVVGGPGG